MKIAVSSTGTNRDTGVQSGMGGRRSMGRGFDMSGNRSIRDKKENDISANQELEDLKEQAERLNKQLKGILTRINNLEKI